MKKSFALFALSLLLAACGPEESAGTESEALAEAAPAEQERVSAFGGCYGVSCNGRDPSAMGCDVDAITRTVAYIRNSAGATVGRVELRFSPSCNAKWSRVFNYINYSTTAWMSDSSPNPMIIGGTWVTSSSSNHLHGNMFFGFIKACGQVGGYAPACTNPM